MPINRKTSVSLVRDGSPATDGPTRVCKWNLDILYAHNVWVVTTQNRACLQFSGWGIILAKCVRGL